MNGELIGNSTAKGCFVVLQPEDGSPDEFRALLRQDETSTSLTSTINSLPNSTYKVIVYDLESSILPNMNPAYEINHCLRVSGEGKILFSVDLHVCTPLLQGQCLKMQILCF